MNNYHITSKDFAISDQGIHMLRNGFDYKTVDFESITKATFIKAVETKYISLSLIFGTLLIVFAMYNMIGVFEDFGDPSVHHIYVESIVLPVLPLLCGVYCVYIGVKKVPLLIVETENQKYKLSLSNIIQSMQLTALSAHLNDKLRNRFNDNLVY